MREKAKQLGNLLRDEERLKNERARALKAKQRFAQSASAFGSDGALDTPSSPTYPAVSYYNLVKINNFGSNQIYLVFFFSNLLKYFKLLK